MKLRDDFCNEMNYKRTNNFYFYSDEMKLQWHIWHKIFFTSTKLFRSKRTTDNNFFFPSYFGQNTKFFFSPRNLIVTTQLFFSLLFQQWDCHNSTSFSPSILYFGNEIVIIKLLSLSLSLLAMRLSQFNFFFCLLSPPISTMTLP